MKKTDIKRLCAVSVLAALAFGLGYIEMMLPPLGIPGAKLGLANLAVLTALYILSYKAAFGVSLTRILLSWLMFGSFTGFVYSLCGGMLSLAAMCLIKKTDRFSPVGVSIAGGITHNIGQLAAAVLFMGAGVLGYLPLLLITGALTGAVNGTLSLGIINILKKVRRE